MKKLLLSITLVVMMLAIPGVANATGEATPQMILKEVSYVTSLTEESLVEGYENGLVEIHYLEDHYEIVVQTEGGTMVIEILDSF